MNRQFSLNNLDAVFPSAGSNTFSYTGQEQTYIVPSNAASVTVIATGASGAAATGTPGCCPGSAQTGGYGGITVTTLPVASGQQLIVNVGGAATGLAGGYNGGGDGSTWQNGFTIYSGGGGGASDVRTGSDLSTRLLVAPGGGGGGGCGGGGDAGGGGETSGSSGQCTAGCSASTTCGGGGASLGSGGAANGCDGYPGGVAGSLGYGGASYSIDCGGAGGGGYYGGGGAGGCCGGGGSGSGYSSGSSTTFSTATHPGDGSVIFIVSACVPGYDLSGGVCLPIPPGGNSRDRRLSDSSWDALPVAETDGAPVPVFESPAPRDTSANSAVGAAHDTAAVASILLLLLLGALGLSFCVGPPKHSSPPPMALSTENQQEKVEENC